MPSPPPSLPPRRCCLLCSEVFSPFLPLDEIPSVGMRVPHKRLAWLCPRDQHGTPKQRQRLGPGRRQPRPSPASTILPQLQDVFDTLCQAWEEEEEEGDMVSLP